MTTKLTWFLFLVVIHTHSSSAWFFQSPRSTSVIARAASHPAWTSTVDTITIIISSASPRTWLESMPNGAYTVLRCDHVDGWKIWGREFHIQRLEKSIQTITNECNTTHAIQQTDQIIQDLLDCCETKVSKANNTHLCDSYMLTVLWCFDQDEISVKGHITPYRTAWNPNEYNPHPLKATLAYSPMEQSKLPSRKEHPQAKLSSWCQRRRPLETKFKIPHEADEVFLVDTTNEQSVRILEGLTSNVFLVHRDGTLYTAPEDCVLGGYARKLVLESAQRLGMNVDASQPVRFIDATLWTEVFVTSAIKLVTPVETILCDARGSSTVLWSQPKTNSTRVWHAIYRDILSHNLSMNE